MKKKLINIIGCALLMSSFVSCSDLKFGDAFLGSQPESSGATTEIMFSSKENSDKVLTKAYRGLVYGISTTQSHRMGGNVLESLTDLCCSFRNNIGDGPMNWYYNGQLSPTNIDSHSAFHYGSASEWNTIRYAWMYIENIDKVPDMVESEKKERVAEAKTLIALSYFRMLRYVGGVTWLDHAISVNESMEFPRITFAQTVDNIVSLLDEAIPDLIWKHDEINDGRMSKAGAMALKLQVLTWAASPTFNSDTKWHEQADEYTCYGNYSKDRWTKAASAGKEFFDAVKLFGGYALIQPATPTHRDRRLAYRKAYYDRGGSEVLISIRHGYDENTHKPYLDNRFYIGPTLNYVEMFPWDDGSDFPENFNWEKPSRQPFFEYSEKEGLVPTRDPRLYESVACPGETYANGTTAPVYMNHAQYRNGTGFLMMKFVLQESSDRENRPVQFSFLRLAETMLTYAEALTEQNNRPTAEAYDMVNAVRARVGLSPLPEDLNKTDFLNLLFKERALELGFEEVRWFDLVRRNMVSEFTKQLYELRTIGDDLLQPTHFTFKKVALDQRRFWADKWDSKWYLAPIPQNEINKKYGMTQNPGW